MSDMILDYMDEMLKNPERLTAVELDWVEKIDHTIAQYTNPAPTSRQAEVVMDIYIKFQRRGDRKKEEENVYGVRNHGHVSGGVLDCSGGSQMVVDAERAFAGEGRGE